MSQRTLISAAFAIAVAVATSGYSSPAAAQYGPGWMGPGMMYGYGQGGGYGPGGMGPGMMYGYGQGGYGPGGMGPGMMYGYGGYGPGAGGYGPPQQANLNLTVDQVKNNMERWVRSSGNPHIKVGNVAAKDADTITAEIVTTDKDALVQRYEINRHSGFMEPTEE